MKQSARTNACIEILEKIGESRVPMDVLIGDYMRGRRYIGSKDRSDIAERVYNIMRAHARLGWHLAQAGAKTAPRTRVIAWLVLGESANAGTMGDLFDGGQYAPAPLSDEEKSLIRTLADKALDDSAMDSDTRCECPPAYAPSLHGYFGKDFDDEMRALISGATLDLRVNTGRIARENAQASLAKDGVTTQPTPYSPWGLRVEGKTFLSKTKAFNKGWIDIQDEGSQLIACLCNAQPGMQVLDYCAGGGGKTLALANMMEGKGRIVATDTEAHRLERARPRFRRAGVNDNIETRPLSDERHRKWLRRQKESFDVVLTDVPCTGTGTWRRNPDLRWYNYGPSLEELLAVQAEILDKVAKTVKPGGRLVYATCSLLPEENEHQIAAFLKKYPEFEILPLAKAWPEGSPVPCKGDFMRLTPHRHGTDGFFAAALLRT